MNFIIYTFIFFSFLKTSFSQENFGVIQKSSAHQNVTGTRVWLIPPKDYTLSKNFKGFQNPADPSSMIMITEIPGSFKEVTETLNKDKKFPIGMEFISRKDFKLGNSDAALIEMNQNSNNMIFRKEALVFGDSTATTMINGIFLKDSVETGKLIEACLRSSFINENQKIDPRGSLDYSVDETGTNLTFNSVIGNGMLFTLDGKLTTVGLSLIITESLFKADIKDKKQYAISLIKRMPYSESKIDLEKGINEIEINGIKGYEIYATGKAKTTQLEEYIYMVVLSDSDKYFLLYGTYRQNSAENIASLKKIIKTFKRK